MPKVLMFQLRPILYFFCRRHDTSCIVAFSIEEIDDRDLTSSITLRHTRPKRTISLLVLILNSSFCVQITDSYSAEKTVSKLHLNAKQQNCLVHFRGSRFNIVRIGKVIKESLFHTLLFIFWNYLI